MKPELVRADEQARAQSASLRLVGGEIAPDAAHGEQPCAKDYTGLKVAYLVNQYPKVSHTFIRREILALERMGAEVTRVALRGWDAEVADPEDRAEQGRTTYTLRHGLAPLASAALRMLVQRPGRFLTALKAAFAMSRSSLRPLPYHLIYLAHACHILPLLERRGVTHLHAHFGTNPAEVAMLVRLLGGPDYSFTVHGPEEIDDARHMGFAHTVPAAKFIAAISSYTRSQLQRHVPYQIWGKIQVVHCGIDEQFFAGTPAEVEDTPQFVCVGRLCEQKGQLALLDAFARVVAGHPEARLVLAGDGEMRAAIEERIAALGIGPAVRITGWISSAEVRRELLASRALVLPSLQEGLPVVIMEAMALRRPVISTFISGIPELVIPGENGWLIPSGSVDDLVAVMNACLEMPVDSLRRMGAAGATRVKARHSIDTEAAKLAAFFARSSGGTGPGQGLSDWQRKTA